MIPVGIRERLICFLETFKSTKRRDGDVRNRIEVSMVKRNKYRQKFTCRSALLLAARQFGQLNEKRRRRSAVRHVDT